MKYYWEDVLVRVVASFGPKMASEAISECMIFWDSLPPDPPYSVKTFGLVETIFWSSQLHACCVRDTLHNFKRDASYLNQSV